ncbi:MAG: glycosyltransferase family 2 protein [Alphaproteobacteria bacterium]|nr:glycosyltransferase family 2 protein [Alphaproteobacteria bacterium]
MIVKNEEAMLDRCLSCVADLVDEIIIADTGSTDKTREIAAKYTDKIHHFDWVDDFGAARNFSFSHATKEWILWLDADDYLREIDRENLKKLKTLLTPDLDAVFCQYNYIYDSAGKCTAYFDRERLVKNDGKPRWIGVIHECMEIRGPTMRSDFEICHGRVHINTGRNVKIFERMLKDKREFSPRDMFYFGKELNEIGRIQDAQVWFEKFLAQPGGWMEDKIYACYCLGTSYKGEAALHALFRSFLYDAPRPNICCAMGDRFLESEKYQIAAYWYRLAFTAPAGGGFILPEFSGYIPAMQLVLCHSYMGDMARAEEYNEVAAQFKPDDVSIEHNRKFFADSKRCKKCCL